MREKNQHYPVRQPSWEAGIVSLDNAGLIFSDGMELLQLGMVRLILLGVERLFQLAKNHQNLGIHCPISSGSPHMSTFQLLESHSFPIIALTLRADTLLSCKFNFHYNSATDKVTFWI